MISCRIKKVVVGVTQLITALVSIHSSMTFLADIFCFLDPPGRTVLFSVNDRSLFIIVFIIVSVSCRNRSYELNSYTVTLILDFVLITLAVCIQHIGQFFGSLWLYCIRKVFLLKLAVFEMSKY